MRHWPAQPFFALCTQLWGAPVQSGDPDNPTEWAGATNTRIAERVGVKHATVRAWRRRGVMSDRMADLAATRLGYHPSEIWSDWDAGIAYTPLEATAVGTYTEAEAVEAATWLAELQEAASCVYGVRR